MIDAKLLADLSRFAQAHGVSELEWSTGGKRFFLRLDASEAATAATLPVEHQPSVVAIKAPTFGLFKQVSDLPGIVAEGDILGHVALDPLVMPVRAPASGRLLSEWPQDGSIVGFGDTLARIEKEKP